MKANIRYFRITDIESSNPALSNMGDNLYTYIPGEMGRSGARKKGVVLKGAWEG